MAFWKFNQTLECYVPEPKRIWGYFCLPILYGDRLVGRFDPKVERRTGVLRIKALYLEPGTSWEVVVLEGAQAQVEKETVLAECHEEGGVTEVHRVEPRFMTEEEIRRYDRHLDPAESPIV